MKQLRLTTVIPVFNAENRVSDCLAHLKKLQIPDTIRHEIVVVNDGSSDDTASIVQKYSDVTLIDLENNVGRSAARNYALPIKTDYLHFIDVDCLAKDPLLLSKVSPYLIGKNRKLLLIGFTTHSSNDFFSIMRRNLKDLKIKKGLIAQSTENIIVAQSVFQQLNGYDEKYREYGFEDRDWLCRAETLIEPENIQYLSDFIVDHPPVETMESFKDKLFISGKSTSLIFQHDHPDEFENMPYSKLENNQFLVFLSRWILKLISIDKILAISDILIEARWLPYFLKKLVYQMGYSLCYLRGVHARKSNSSDKK